MSAYLAGHHPSEGCRPESALAHADSSCSQGMPDTPGTGLDKSRQGESSCEGGCGGGARRSAAAAWRLSALLSLSRWRRSAALRREPGPRSEDCFDGDRSLEDIGLAAGRSQREKKRSYKDLLREEEEIAAQVRKSSKKRLKERDLFSLGTDTHKRRRKHSSGESCYGDLSHLESSQKKKKKVVPSPPSSDTAMDLLKAITSPLATGSKPPRKTGEKSSFSSFSSSSYSESKKEQHPRKKVSSSSGELSLEDSGFHKAKKMKPLYVNTETLTLREPDGLKMKLILSPKEKEGRTGDEEPFQNPPQQGTTKKSSKKSARDEQGTFLLGHELHSFLKTARKKHKQASPDQHPSPGREGFGSDASIFPESHAADYELSNVEPALESGSSSRGELEAGELVIDDSYWEIKKKKKSKKSKKQKDKERHKEKRHSKSKKGPGLSTAVTTVGEATSTSPAPPPPTSTLFPGAVPPPPLPPPPPPPPPPPVFHTDGQSEKKKKKEEKEKEKAEKAEKVKNWPARLKVALDNLLEAL
ncbi:LOW QUALITY PROTEIN: HMG domain-containing protein 4-like [Gracilinanus agilis]|uniref:LOW QUALITY PROTEIN: HMG domain-containing protein 4-like n=1 Tax=Gracilinanus agilis TaxID=191870 RepID=UPI001CFE4DF2|nr:LOW QUALITY PROTEIN: HMG domain-containing protein 4-like [Gracilinanus agilis]